MSYDDFSLLMKLDELIRATDRVADAVESSQIDIAAMQADVATIKFETEYELQKIRTELETIQINTSA
jgi:hypothetical protein